MGHHFYSSLPLDYEKSIESLFYFNKNQNLFRKKIESIVEVYGIPKLKSVNQRISIELDKTKDSQCLFLLTEEPPEGKLIGILIHLRYEKSAEVIHLAIDDKYNISKQQHVSPVFELLKELHRIYHQIKGVTTINILYSETILKINKIHR